MNIIRKYPAITFFTLTLLWSDGIWILLIPQVQKHLALNLNQMIAWVGLMGPGLIAIVLSLLIDGRRGLRELFSPLLRWRVSSMYYIFIYIGVLVFYFTAASLTVLLEAKSAYNFSLIWKGATAPFFGFHGIWVIVEITIIYTFCEELGWRGFALPRMVENINVLYCAVILGFFWTAWHIPLIYLYGSSLDFHSGAIYFLHLECLSIIYAWLYFRTGKSLLMCGLFHGATDGIGGFFPLTASTIGQGPNLTTLSLEVMVALLMVPYLLKLRIT